MKNNSAQPSEVLGLDARKSERYLIYRMLRRLVSFTEPGGRKKVSGYADDVYRDIFTSEILVRINGKVYRFQEPESIRMAGDSLVFSYGRKSKDVSDDVLFDEARKSDMGEPVTNIIGRISPGSVREVRISIGGKKPSRKRSSLLKKVDAAP